MAHFALVSDVREESQNVTIGDFPDAEIEKEMDAAAGIIRGKIGSYDANNTQIDALKKVERLRICPASFQATRRTCPRKIRYGY
jgi:hypothetical protein